MGGTAACRGGPIRTPRRLRPPHPGSVVAVAIVALVLGAFAALLSAASDRPALLAVEPYLGRVLAFSLAQAALSTALSLGLGAALALALARRTQLPGRGLVLAALGAAAVMPAVVVVFAVVAVYGRSGWLAEGLRALGLPGEVRVFGWPGILLAHVFLNAPLVARVCLDALGRTPAEHWRLAEALGFSPADVFRHLDAPVLRAELPGLAGLVFLLCFTSFAVVLALGGGPGRATLEVAIYEALRLDLDFARAAWLALIQVAICLGLAALLRGAVPQVPLGETLRAPRPRRPDAADRRLKALDAAVLLAGALLIAPPLASVLLGLSALPAILDADVIRALVTSLTVAMLAATVACALALALATAASRARRARPRLAALHDLAPMAALAVPPFALAAGLFLVARRFTDPTAIGYALLPLVNGLGALPFAYRFVAPALAVTEERYGRLAAHLGLAGAARLRIVDGPTLRRPLAAGFAVAMALSFGDFGVVALFGGHELRTLPSLLYERLGAYRVEEASAIGLLLVAIAFGLAYAAARWSGSDAPR